MYHLFFRIFAAWYIIVNFCYRIFTEIIVHWEWEKYTNNVSNCNIVPWEEHYEESWWVILYTHDSPMPIERQVTSQHVDSDL